MNNTETITVAVKRLDHDTELPSYAYEGDAGLDLRSAMDITLAPLERRVIPTGLAIAIPAGYAGFVQPRSGFALRYGLSIANTPGLIDSRYRGEIMVCAVNLDMRCPIRISRGDRIAQLVIQKVPEVTIVEVDDLDQTPRGAKGLGSSGIN